MKKNICLLFICSMSLGLFSCSSTSQEILPYEKDKDTLYHIEKKSPQDLSPEEAIYASLGKLDRTSTYLKSGTSFVYAEKDTVSYQWSTTILSIKNQEMYYQEYQLDTSCVSFHHEAFLENDKIAFRKDGGNIACATKEDYIAYYGLSPDKILSGYLFNQDTLLSPTLTSYNEETFTYRFSLDPKTSTASTSKMMFRLGNMETLPTYQTPLLFTLKINKDFTPIECSYQAQYTSSSASYGELSCKENTTYTFSAYNEKIEIPDQARFHLATFLTPSPIEDTSSITAKQELLSAFMKSDFAHGVSLSCVLPLQKENIGIELQAKVNMNKILFGGEKEIRNALDAMITLSNSNENVSIFYHENELYFNGYGRKYAFALPEETPSTYLESNGSGQDYLSFSKVKGSQGLYQVSLKKEVLQKLLSFLPIEDILQEAIDISKIDVSALIFVENEKIQKVRLQVSYLERSLGINMLYQDKTYVVPTDLDSYESKFQFEATLPLYLSPFKDDVLNGELIFSYNASIPNIEEAFTMELNISLNDGLSSFLGYLENASIKGEFFSSLTKADTFRILIHNGNLTFVLTKEDQVIWISSSSLSSLFDGLKEVDGTSILQWLMTHFQIHIDNDQLVFTLTPTSLASFQELWNHLDERLIALYGEEGITLYQLLGLYQPLVDFRMRIPLKESQECFFLDLDVYNVNKDEIYDETRSYTPKAYLSMKMIKEEVKEDYVFSFDVEKYLSYEEKAASFRKEIDLLKEEFALSEDYLSKLSLLEKKYNSFNKETQSLVRNALDGSLFTSLKHKYETQKKVVDDFASSLDVTSLKEENHLSYDSFTKAEHRYFTSTYSNLENAYLEKRKKDEKDQRKEIEDLYSNIILQENETLEECKNTVLSLAEIKEKMLHCYSASSSLPTFQETYEKEIQKLVSLLIEKTHTYETNNGENLSFSSFVTYYEEMMSFYQTYYVELLKSPYLANDILNLASNFENEKATFFYYLNGNKGIRSTAKMQIQEAIEEAKELENDDLENQLALIEKLMDKVKKENINNYETYLLLKQKLD